MEQNVFYAWNVLEIVQRMHFKTNQGSHPAIWYAPPMEDKELEKSLIGGVVMSRGSKYSAEEK